jgi:flagellar M-ring protein FliF
MDRLLQRLEPLRVIWASLGRWTRIAIAGGAVAIALAMIVFIASAARPSYAVAFSRLSEEDAGAIVAKLKEGRIPYRVTPAGAIEVPRERVQEVRMQLAAAGLPRGGNVGFELFNQNSFGITDFMQKLNYQRALEGELARTIQKLEPVDQARVHLALPQPSLFTDNQREPTASVVVRLKPGRKLERAQVQSIVHLLSRSVEGLKPQNVTVVDAEGTLLSGDDQPEQAVARLTAGQLEAKRTYESELEKNVQAMLDRVLGPGKASVRVNATMAWDQVETSSETYSPANRPPQVRSSRELSERVLTTAQPGGVPGTDANIPPTQEPVAAPGQNRGPFERRETTTNYELSKTVEKTIKAPGAVQRLSVAVVLDSAVPIEQAQVEALTNLVAAAVGVDQSRGDVVSVAAMPFNRAESERIQRQFEEALRWELVLNGVRLVAALLGPLLLLVALWLLLGRPGRSRRVPEEARVGGAPSHRELVPTGAVTGSAAGGESASHTVEAAPEAPVEDESEEPLWTLPGPTREQKIKARRRTAIREQITRLAAQSPDTLAQLIQTWIDEDRRN